MADFKVKKGLDIKVLGKPAPTVQECARPQLFSVYPSEFEGIKPRLKVAEGDSVRQGDVLFENKKDEQMLFRSPCSGTVKAIKLGARRAPQEIIIERSETDESVTFDAIAPDTVTREKLVAHLLNTGYWPLIRQRPFSKIADPAAAPKAVFVNAMNSAPFQADFGTVLKGDENHFQAGLAALGKLTEGKVHLCTAPGMNLPDLGNVEIHTFEGPHPSGNTSIHINRVCPIEPHDTVYTLRAQDAILIGKLLLTGTLPTTKVIALGGPGVKPQSCRHYRVWIGGCLKPVFDPALTEGTELRIISGNILSGTPVAKESAIRFYDQEITVVEEDRSRHFLGWTTPGWLQYSVHRLNLSVLRKSAEWNLGTNLHGGHRAMVVTGWYDKYMPLNIMTDYLVRAVLAHDTEEAIQLGILETDPEDFALCAFIDPAKNDLCGIIKQGLEEIEEEGI
ncbi:MAG: Na(+)-translocating NADH-quinone reductase subunit A [Kiritimatiellales bacterium]|nr:Na(+)-translocating NADH-quinone reductase subunit A [Kiritimatiellales bacterium]